MPSLRDIRKRIRSVKNTQQITKAMKMVAAAKLRKAQDAIIAARPYAAALDQVIAELVARSESVAHPLLQCRPSPKKAEILVLTSDRGLAGGFNSNVIRRAQRFITDSDETYDSVQVSTIGRKGHDYFKKRSQEVRKDYAGLFSKVSYRAAADIAQELSHHYISGEVDAVFLVYNEFLSAINQRVSLVQLLPLQTLTEAQAGKELAVDFKYEPGQPAVLERLVPTALAVKVYRALLESIASEHGARMSAMENATQNAGEMIGKLSLYYNRTRQAVITKELMEIVSGAEALKK